MVRVANSKIEEVLKVMKGSMGYLIKLPATSEGNSGTVRFDQEDEKFIFYPQSRNYYSFECSDEFVKKCVVRSLLEHGNSLQKFFYYCEYPI